MLRSDTVPADFIDGTQGHIRQDSGRLWLAVPGELRRLHLVVGDAPEWERRFARGKKVRTTWADAVNQRPTDLVQRQFHAMAPNRLWVADLTYVLPVTAAGYVISTFLGRAVLHEQVSLTRWMGAILISVGTALVVAS